MNSLNADMHPYGKLAMKKSGVCKRVAQLWDKKELEKVVEELEAAEKWEEEKLPLF